MSYNPNSGGGGSGTVTSVGVATANGFSGTVASPTSTPTITVKTTVTGLLKGDGTGVSAASAGTDYLAPNGDGSDLTGITAGQVGADPSGTAAELVSWQSTTVDFGASPIDQADFVIAAASCTAESILEFTVSGTSSTATNGTAEHVMAAQLFWFAATPGSGSFSVKIGTQLGFVSGEFIIKYRVGQ